jgi:hypothetical protein
MQIEAMPLANRPATVRSKVSNGTRLLAGVDGRSATARRFRDLIAELTIEAGGGEGLSAAERGAIRQAAAILLRAEQVQAAIVKGEPVDNDEFIRLSGEARRVLAGLRKRAPPPPGSLLKDYLRNRTQKPVGECSEGSA